MDKILSGKELCNQFFKALINRDGIDRKVAELLKKLYFESRLARDNIIQELKALREGKNE